MTPIEPLVLYVRPDCHLCEQVVAMLDRLDLQWDSCDIDSDARLTEKYGLVIPVLRHPESGRELLFPFDEATLRSFVSGESQSGVSLDG